MSPLPYVRSHWLPALLGALSVMCTYGLVLLVTWTHQTALLVTLVEAGPLLAAGASNLLRWDSFAKGLEEVAEADKEDVLSLASEMRRPGFMEGDVAASAVIAVARAANDTIGALAAEQSDYREFVETWVHETKTPLAAASLMLENRADQDLESLRIELDHIDNYVEQALFYARSGSVEKDYVIQGVPLDRVVKEAVRSRASQLISTGMSVDLSGLGSAPPVVPCDAKWVVFVLGQLIDNAVRYRVLDKSRKPTLFFSACTLGEGTASERVELEVRDNGCGIAAADIGRVFEKGFTGSNGRDRKKSTGIGLFLARRLCDKMGLAIGIASEDGCWTSVTVTFPRPCAG